MTNSKANRKPRKANVADLVSVAEIVSDWLPRYRRRTAIRFDNGESYTSLEFDAYLENVQRMVCYLRGQGAEQRVIATFVKNRPEWDMTAFGSLYTANILFPLDTSIYREELRHLLRLSPTEYILVSVAER
jgi:long-subunit acyl-CoA synthetase (AMP-forming)